MKNGTKRKQKKTEKPSNRLRRGSARKFGTVFGQIVVYFVLICIGFVYLEPIFEIIAKSFMSAEDIVDPSTTWIPKKFSIENLKVAANVLNLPSTLISTILFAGVMAFMQTFVSAMTAFALSRYKFKGKSIWMVMLILTFIIPVPVLMIPRLMMFVGMQTASGVQLIGTPIPQGLMAILGQGVYSAVLVLIFYTSFNMVPRVLDEAAEIDGASVFKVFWLVVVRISASTILVVFLFAFVWNWNETYITGTLLRGKIALLPQKLSLFNSEFDSLAAAAGSAFRLNEAYKMSATLLSISPLLIMYAFVQRKFIQGIENTGITGE